MGKYEEFLGKNYTGRIRNMLGADDNLLPDSIIDADINIGGMKTIIAPVVEKLTLLGKIKDEKSYKHLQEAAIYILAGILCIAMKSRTSTPPYDAPEYKRNWDKKREKFMRYGNEKLRWMMQMGYSLIHKQ